jgi:hypothetical protein
MKHCLKRRENSNFGGKKNLKICYNNMLGQNETLRENSNFGGKKNLKICYNNMLGHNETFVEMAREFKFWWKKNLKISYDNMLGQNETLRGNSNFGWEKKSQNLL